MQVDAAWACVLRRATPRTLAAAACVSRALRAAVSELRARDVAAGCEDVAVLAPDAAAAAQLRVSFTYTHGCSGAAAEAEDICGGGCSCTGEACDAARCSCARAHNAPLLECGPACGCGARCPNRVTQQRVAVPLSLRRDARRGWCVIADASLPAGCFVCCYAGELLRCEEAGRRLAAQDACEAANYILVLREHAGARTFTTCIDPTRAGNVGRFLNHACDGGSLELRAVRAAGWPVPRAAFFTRRRISAGKELTYAYGAGGSARGGGTPAKPCYCGTAACTGLLPFDDVLED